MSPGSDFRLPSTSSPSWSPPFPGVFLIYCCITKDPKTSQLKTINICYLSFRQSGIQEWLKQVFLVQGLSRGCNQDINQDCSHLKAWLGGEPTSELTHMLLHRLHHNTAAGFPKSEWSQRMHPRWKPQSFYNLISEWHPITSAVFYALESSQSPIHTQKEGITQRHKCQEVGIIGANLGAA